MKTFETLLNFLSGISTFGWILLVAATVAFIIGTFLTISAFKRHKKKSKSGNLNIFSTAATTKELKRLEEIVKRRKKQPKKYGTAHLVYIKGTNVRW
ncbi:MAG TPA: hypothetical protein PLO44_00945 [Candidatus Paceibacterota bacterium]|nr:hypothetical protein [Candidatus Paceibacterota bacterium]